MSKLNKQNSSNSKQHDKSVCDPRGTGRNDQKCSDCQNEIRRATKKHKG